MTLKHVIELSKALDAIGIRIAEESMAGDRFAKRDIVQMAQDYHFTLACAEHALESLYEQYKCYLSEPPKGL